MKLARKCSFYLKGGLCSHKDAPEPGHSRCIGKGKCDNFSKVLGQAQQNILDKMRNGWELGLTSGGRGRSFCTLQKGGHGYGGESIHIPLNTLYALFHRKLLVEIYGFPTKRYILKKEGK